jgi:hypothetical protein
VSQSAFPQSRNIFLFFGFADRGNAKFRVGSLFRERTFGARALWGPNFEAPKIRIQIFQKILKKYHGVDNVVF